MEEGKISVTLLSYTPNPEKVIATAMRQSRYSESVGKLDLNETEIKHLLNLAITLGHLSVFEHAFFTFAISGISRSCSHQFVRHRLFSFTQQSQRYVKLNNKEAFVIPPLIEENNEALRIYEEELQNIFNTYQKLLSLKVPEEDARFILPNATETKIVATANVRELMHFFKLRLDKSAQWEIRALAQKMFNLVSEIAPDIFNDENLNKFE